MKTAHVVRGPLGIFAFDDDGTLIMYKIFDSFRDFLSARLELDYEMVEDELAKSFYREKMRELATLKFTSDEELNKYLTIFGIEWSKHRMKQEANRDSLLVQAVRTYEDLQKEVNVMAEHFYEWVVPYYPELREEPLKAVKMFAEYGRRENFPNYRGSVGIDISEEDLKALSDYANVVNENVKYLKSLERYIKSVASDIAPNMSKIVGPLIAARLISKAGSLKKIASMSSSTIQLLGAEKALFRFLKGKKRGRPPKYGIIYFSPYIQRAKKSSHGKLARIISSKLAIAAKVDYYSKRLDTELIKSFEREINSVME